MFFENKRTVFSIKMSLHSATICVLVVLSAFTSLSLVDGRSEAIQNPHLMKLIWLPFGEKPPKHISSEALEGPLSQLPYINVSPSRAPKQLLGARYVSLRITTSTLTGLLIAVRSRHNKYYFIST